jgi:hypothetical protein
VATSASAAGQLLRVRPSDPAGRIPISPRRSKRWGWLKAAAKEVNDPVDSRQSIEAIDWSPTKVPGPYDEKTGRKEDTSPKTSHKDDITDYPKDTTTMASADKGEGDLQERVLGKKARHAAQTLPGGRFPMPDKEHARKALQLLPKAKNLSPDDEAKIKSRAVGILGHKTDTTKKVRETLVFTPTLLEGTYNPATRTADVIIIETGMGNRRDKHYYGDDTLEDAVQHKVFDGAQAYADHPSASEETDRPERSVKDLIGYYSDSRLTTRNGHNAISAKLKVQEGHDWVIGLIKESVAYNQKFPDKVYAGISINADGDVSPAQVNGQDVNYVHRITSVFSADVVTKPARGGKFLTLIESASGARKGAPVSKLAEAAKVLRAQAKENFVDPTDLDNLLKLVEADKECAETKESKGADDGVTNAKEAKESKGGNAVAPVTDKRGDNDGVDADNDEDDEAQVQEGKKPFPGAAAEFGAKESKTVESDIRESHPSLFAAALVEAKRIVESDSKSTEADLRKKLAEAKAQIALRESVDTAKNKLKASTLPESAAIRLLESCVGKTPTEMDRLIENETNYIADLGAAAKRPTSGNPERVTVRESDLKANTAAIFGGLGE